MRTARLNFLIGAFLVLTGIFIPSSTLIESLRTIPGNLREQLLLGATVFKVGLGMLGLFTMILGTSVISRRELYIARPSPDSARRYHLFILAAMLFAAAILRLYALDSGLWFDEIRTYVTYVKRPWGEIISTYDSPNQHLFYNLLAHVSYLAFGGSSWSLRLPAVVFGVASIWALYLLGRHVSTPREALLSTALLAFSYHHVWFSQNARGYTGLLFWTILASWLFLRGLDDEGRWLWLLYAIAAAFGVYTHMTMIFVIIGHFIIYLTTLFARRRRVWPNKWAGFFLGFCVAGFLAVQLHAFVLPQLLGGILGEGKVVTAWTNPLWTLLEFSKGMQMNFAGSVVATGTLVVTGAGFLSYARTKPVVLQLLLIPALICAAVVIGMGNHLWPRYFFFTMGFGALVIVRGTIVLGQLATQLLRVEQAKSVPIGTALCASLIFVSALSIPSAYGPKQDYRGALDFVTERKRPDDAVVTVGLATFPYESFYDVKWKRAESTEALNAIRSRAKRTWLLYTFPVHLRAVYPDIMEGIQSDFRVVKVFPGTVGDGAIYVCRSVEAI